SITGASAPSLMQDTRAPSSRRSARKPRLDAGITLEKSPLNRPCFPLFFSSFPNRFPIYSSSVRSDVKTHVRHLRNYRSGRQPDPTKSIALNASPLGAARSRRRGLAGTTGRGPGPSPPQHHRLDGKGTATDGGRRAGTYRRVQRGDLQLSRIEAGAYDHGIPVFLLQRHGGSPEGLPRLGRHLRHPPQGNVRLLPLRRQAKTVYPATRPLGNQAPLLRG